MLLQKLSSDQTHVVALTASTESHVSFNQGGASGEVRPMVAKEITLVNTDATNLVYFRYDGVAASGAAGNDRVLLPHERLVLARDITKVSLFCAAAVDVEVTFSA